MPCLNIKKQIIFYINSGRQSFVIHSRTFTIHQERNVQFYGLPIIATFTNITIHLHNYYFCIHTSEICNKNIELIYCTQGTPSELNNIIDVFPTLRVWQSSSHSSESVLSWSCVNSSKSSIHCCSRICSSSCPCRLHGLRTHCHNVYFTN